MSQTTITDIGTVGVPVSDQDKALAFFTATLGFEKRLDLRADAGFRWVTVAAPGAAVSVALICTADKTNAADNTADKTGGDAVGQDTGIRFMVPDAGTEHTAMRERGIEVGDLLRWPGVPPMYEFKDLDGNRFEVVEGAA